jgi:hypothetical protein
MNAEREPKFAFVEVGACRLTVHRSAFRVRRFPAGHPFGYNPCI